MTRRFEFGENWSRFLAHLDEDRIAEAERSLKEMLDADNLDGLCFLDIGCGSGLFSLAARRLGAKVHSFDYDPQSVACAETLRSRYFPKDAEWVIEEGSVLDKDYLSGLGCFDIVYSWGVLHHTGSMWEALDKIVPLVADRGKLFIAIYNHQIHWTDLHKRIKRAYVGSSILGKSLIAGCYISVQIAKGLLVDFFFFKNPMRRYLDKRRDRGMSVWHDWIDWIGGYPFEAAKPEEIFAFYQKRGFVLRKLVTRVGGHGCNEFVFFHSPAGEGRDPAG